MKKYIALLVCDTVMDTVKDVHGDYYAMFTRLLHASGEGIADSDIEGKVQVDAYDVQKMVYPKDLTSHDGIPYDGILITGSKDSAYTDVPWINKLVEYVAEVADGPKKIKIVGICFGHQIIARALGGKCVANGGKWEVGITQVGLTELGKKVFGIERPLYIEEMHQDHVPEVPANFHLLGSTDVSINQGMVRFNSEPPESAIPSSILLSDIQIFTVQGHPEFNEPIVSEILRVRAASGVIPEATATKYGENPENRDGGKNDGVSVIRKAILGVYGISLSTS
ncbi:class I glutamine amidotransferase-like protein [Mycena maculata]|uniref:Class I glutamine amidotransferase-like protein n=1 Tax=Mycena maculata TaxID=230809 RepID=A0AAD7IDZ6_9AGAR|nr:class I glutamine amidotransferase-like protein [Mycena maculata]